MRASRRLYRGRSNSVGCAVFLIGVVMAVGVNSSVVNAHLATTSTATGHFGRSISQDADAVPAVASQTNSSSSGLLNQVIIDTLVNEVYANLSDSGSQTSDFPPASSTAAGIYASYRAAAATALFCNLSADVGAAGFSVTLDSQATTGLTNAYFAFDYPSGNVSNTVYWEDNLTSETLSGPISESVPMVSATVMLSVNWGGWSFWGPSSPYLNSVNTDEVVPTVSVDSSYSVSGVDQVATVWNGLTNSAGYLLQDGFLTDASDPSEYNGAPFWEFACPPGDSCPDQNVAHTDLGMSAARPGDQFSNEVGWSGIEYWWDESLSDYTTGAHSLTSFTVQPIINGFHPQWTAEIVEAFEYGSTIQQIAEFSQVDFYDVSLCPSGGGSCYTSYSQYDGSSNVYQLTQNCAEWFLGDCISVLDNTDQDYNDAYGGYWGDYGYPDVSWVSSSYDYDYVN
jgi:hypothetical protein